MNLLSCRVLNAAEDCKMLEALEVEAPGRDFKGIPVMVYTRKGLPASIKSLMTDAVMIGPYFNGRPSMLKELQTVSWENAFIPSAVKQVHTPSSITQYPWRVLSGI